MEKQRSRRRSAFLFLYGCSRVISPRCLPYLKLMRCRFAPLSSLVIAVHHPRNAEFYLNPRLLGRPRMATVTGSSYAAPLALAGYSYSRQRRASIYEMRERERGNKREWEENRRFRAPPRTTFLPRSRHQYHPPPFIISPRTAVQFYMSTCARIRLTKLESKIQEARDSGE